MGAHWDHGSNLIPGYSCHSPQADTVTITLHNQKNRQRDAVVHHEALPKKPLCPCGAAARRFISMRLCDPYNANAMLSLLYTPHKQVSAAQMAGGIRVAALRSIIWLQGYVYDLLRTGPHSLYTSGAIQLKRNGVSDSMIQKMGRWSS